MKEGCKHDLILSRIFHGLEGRLYICKKCNKYFSSINKKEIKVNN